MLYYILQQQLLNRMKSHTLIAIIAVVTLTGCASVSPDHCVYLWGGDIPKELRTKENCRYGYSHWDRSGTGGGTSSGANPNLPRTIITSGGNFAVIPNYSSGGVSAVIQTSRGARSR